MEERNVLFKGLEEFGVGAWREINRNLLPSWSEHELRIKAARLLGSQSVARYSGQKLDRASVEKERSINKEIGERLGCWKGGVLVEDSQGRVRAEFSRIAEESQNL